MRTTAKACFIGMILASFALTGTAYGQEKKNLFFEVTTSTCAIVRAQPTRTSAKLGCMATGTVLPVTDVVGDWVKVSAPTSDKDEVVGYIFKTLGKILELAEDKKADEPAPAASSESKPAPAPASLPSTSTPVRTVVPKPVAKPAAATQAPPAPATAQGKKGPGRFGVGLDIAAAPGGFAPSVMYDVSDRISVDGAVQFYSGVTVMLGELMYAFPRPPDPSSDFAFKPYAGGGLVRASVDYGFGSESFGGFVGSAGSYITVKKAPNWRFNADVSFFRFNADGLAVSGIGVRMGAHYFFSRP